MVRVRRAAEWMHMHAVAVPLHACSGRSRPKRQTGVNNQRSTHRTHRFAHARPYPRLHCSLSKRIFFCSLFSLFFVAKSAKPNECLLYSCWVWVHLPGTPRDTPRSRLLPRPAFSAASCPPAVRPPKSLPHFTVAGAGLQRPRPAAARRGLDVWLQQTTILPLSLSLPATVTNSATESIERSLCCYCFAHGSRARLDYKFFNLILIL